MKKLLLALVCLFGVTLTVSADKDKPISENQLPAAARQFIKTHFPKNKIAMAKQETTSKLQEDFFRSDGCDPCKNQELPKNELSRCVGKVH